MKASETKLQLLIEGTKQYVIPLFQREYSWGQTQLRTLWNDILEIYNDVSPKDHFMGSIVTMPTQSKPEGVSKFLVIDGQQRLTTFFIILSVVRDYAKDISNLSNLIEDLYLFNKYSEGNDYYKLLPTQGDRIDFFNTLKGDGSDLTEHSSQVVKAYHFISKQIKAKNLNIEKLKNILITNFFIVSITLDKEDNPYRIFESLNATGLPLAESDLIRNYFFMRIDVRDQNDVYKGLWQPMQKSLDKFDKENEKGKTLSDYIRHFLMKDGRQVKEKEVYSSLKLLGDLKNDDEIILYLTDIYDYSKFYLKLLNPENEENMRLRNKLKKLNRLDISTTYSFLLNIYNLYKYKKISETEFLEILDIIENFIVRRFVCGVPTNQLNKIFPVLFKTLDLENLSQSLKDQLKDKNYPKNSKFKANFVLYPLYGKGRDDKAKLILESLDTSYGHKELVNYGDTTIEHIMPQTLDDSWKGYLGENWEYIHENYLSTIGNLTLTGYNSELSNAPFDIKKKEYKNSHLELNKYFNDVNVWNEEQITRRAKLLVNQAIVVWPSLWGDKEVEDILNNIISSDATGKKPVSLLMLNQKFYLNTWKDVLIKTLENLYLVDEERFSELVEDYPNRLSKTPLKFNTPYDLGNGYFAEVRFSAETIRKFCMQIINRFELTQEDWQVEIKQN